MEWLEGLTGYFWKVKNILCFRSKLTEVAGQDGTDCLDEKICKQNLLTTLSS